jgi:Leucine-rich repeat (LRR) protein
MSSMFEFSSFKELGRLSQTSKTMYESTHLYSNFKWNSLLENLAFEFDETDDVLKKQSISSILDILHSIETKIPKDAKGRFTPQHLYELLKFFNSQRGKLPDDHKFELFSESNIINIDALINAHSTLAEINLKKMWPRMRSKLSTIDDIELPEITADGKTIRMWLNTDDNQDHLSQISELNLNNLKLTYLPEEICKLTNLTLLSLSDNKLTTLPESIGSLSNLTELNLIDNNFSNTYKSFLSLSHFFRNCFSRRRDERSILDNKYSLQDIQAVPTVKKALKTTGVIALGAIAAVGSFFARRFYS